MSVLIGAGVVAIMATGYVGRKGWLAFHRAVGITPGTLKYVEPSQLPLPPMLQLTLAESQIKGLPPVVTEQLLRIDGKADVFQQLRTESIEGGQTLALSEEEFVVGKLLQTRLPELINSYQRIARQEALLQQATNRASIDKRTNLSINTVSATNTVSTTSTANNSSNKISENKQQALDLLLQVLSNIENQLDSLLKRHQIDALQDMQVMQRYLKQRE
ncbi:hypothetical protein [Psychrobacter sp.]|uniref:hypothetical protein n=1 Tax=Psychrobacter sp. TaxID=56811 RepID=UPI0025E406FE|nr:hypothetical protein [Psychrobacter sp.]